MALYLTTHWPPLKQLSFEQTGERQSEPKRERDFDLPIDLIWDLSIIPV